METGHTSVVNTVKETVKKLKARNQKGKIAEEDDSVVSSHK